MIPLHGFRPGPRRSTPAAPAGIFAGAPRRGFLARPATLLMVVASVATGALVEHQASKSNLLRSTMPLTPAPSSPLGLPGPVTLRGPVDQVTLPMSTPVLLHVHGDPSADAMAAEEALTWLSNQGELDLGIPVVNVAVGAIPGGETNRPGEFSVLDPAGAALARPLGTGAFATLLMDEHGFVRFADRPDHPGFAQRLAGAIAALKSAPGNAHLP